jgi:glucose-6-phosphate isomerase
VAVGTTDMHAQTQQHQDGVRDKVVQFLRIAEWGKPIIVPDVFSAEAAVAKFAGISLAEALEVARESNAEALAADGRFSAMFELPELTAFHLGELLYLLALSVAYEGELADVDAFDQPGVEAYKRIMGPKLARLEKK